MPLIRVFAVSPVAVALAAFCALAPSLSACGEESHEQTPRDLPLFASGAGLSGTAPTDLGYTVELVRAQVSLRDLQLTILGETHTASSLRPLLSLFVGTAFAHPGHYAGGEVTGELAGSLEYDATPGADPAPLGTARALPGVYRGANLAFGRAVDGHTARIEGRAMRQGVTVTFTATLDVASDAQVVGLPFDADLTGDTAGFTAQLALLVTDPALGRSLFDGLDFAAADAADGATDGTLSIDPGSADASRLARQLVRHDFWYLTLETENAP